MNDADNGTSRAERMSPDRSGSRHPFPILFAAALLLNLVIESLARFSLLAGLSYLFSRPLSFLLNTLPLFLTFSLCLLFRRRIFVLTLVAAGWLVLGTANAVVVSFRASPLSGIDFAILRSCLPIVKVYLRSWHVILIVLFLAALAWAAVRLYRRSVTYAVRIRREVPLFLSAVLLAGGGFLLSVKAGAVDTAFSDLPGAYEEYGFVTCFSLTVMDRGIEEPDAYSESVLLALKNTLSEEGSAAGSAVDTDSGTRPNIVAVQLESFIDPERIRGAVYSESPVPFFSSLTDRYPSGFLRVNTVGGGTANTEFEVLTGIDLTYFGAGEYPYQTILGENDSVSESMASDLKEAGYAAHAVHNHSGSFYDRYRVYAALGFDDFTPLEYMNGTETNPLGWAKDAVLTDVVLDCLDATEEPDFVFAVSVQGHGMYPDTDESPEIRGPVRLLEAPEGWTDDQAAQLAYYAGQVREMDDFLRELCAMLERRVEETGEGTLLLLYGDHLPPLPFDSGSGPEEPDGSKAQDGGASPFTDGSDVLSAEYVIVPIGFAPDQDCFGDADLEAWEAGMRTLRMAGCRAGLVNRCHAALGESEAFPEALRLLAYDMLYGERYAWNGEAPFRRAPLVLGIRDIVVRSAVLSGPAGAGEEELGTESPFFGQDPFRSVLTVRGDNFTPFSVVTVNGRAVRTEFVSRSELRAEVRANPGDAVAVVQRTEDFIDLGSAESVPAIRSARDEGSAS